MRPAVEQVRPWLRPGLSAALSLVVVVAAAADTASGLRTAAVVAFLTVGPGFGLVGILGIRDGWRELALAIGLSFAVDVLVVGAFQYAGEAGAARPLAVLIGITVAGAAADLWLRRTERADGRAAA
jgi:hypothetical protein